MGDEFQQRNGVAIVGMGCRFPAGDGIDRFWKSLLDGREAIAPMSPQRRQLARALSSNRDWEAKLDAHLGGYIEDIEHFDAAFFDISPDEARCMDPQQRLLLEVAWMAVEHAGIVPSRLNGSDTGVFVGIGGHDFSVLSWPGESGAHASTGASVAIAANRISYTFGLRGPSLSIDSACSSSLVAVHFAVRSILQGECEVALAGGANVLLLPQITAALSGAGRISPDGRCRPFGETANGFVRGEGAGMIVLKSLDAAMRDRDRVLALVVASGVNHNGRSNGLSAPNPSAQAELIRRGLAAAQLTPDSIGYVEAAATGTPFGDAIEMKALNDSLVASREPTGSPLIIGSVKGNIGHLEAAGGIAGLIKTVLSLQDGRIPHSLHSERLNPMCRIDSNRVIVAQSTLHWSAGVSQRNACVNTFGFGGTNAQVIVRGFAQEPVDAPDDGSACLLLVSAKSPAALAGLLQRYREFCRAEPDRTRDLCASAACRRTHWRYRGAVMLRDGSCLDAAFDAAQRRWIDVAGAPRQRMVVLRGNLHRHGILLLRMLMNNSEFRALVDEADDALGRRLAPPLLQLIRCGENSVDEEWFPIALDYCVARWLLRLLPGRDGFAATGLGEIAAAILLLNIPLCQLDALLSGELAIDRACVDSVRSLPLYVLPQKDAAAAGHVAFWRTAEMHVAPDPKKTLFIDLVPEPGAPDLDQTVASHAIGASAASQIQLLQALYLAGADIDWSTIHPSSSYEFIPPPDYPFDRVWCWQWPAADV